jgi:hypothetical protein
MCTRRNGHEVPLPRLAHRSQGVLGNAESIKTGRKPISTRRRSWATPVNSDRTLVKDRQITPQPLRPTAQLDGCANGSQGSVAVSRDAPVAWGEKVSATPQIMPFCLRLSHREEKNRSNGSSPTIQFLDLRQERLPPCCGRFDCHCSDRRCRSRCLYRRGRGQEEPKLLRLKRRPYQCGREMGRTSSCECRNFT